MRKLVLLQSRFLSTIVLTLLGMVCIALPHAIAQQASQGQQPATNGQKSDDSQEPTTTLKVNVNVVQLFFNVKDKHGALIPNLTKTDFDIAEDGKPQTIKYFTAESNL